MSYNPNQTNHIGQPEARKYLYESMTNQSRNNSTKARQNAGDQIVTGLSFASDWLRKKREFSRPITHRSKANPNAILDYLRNSIKKIVLYSYEKFPV